LQVNATLSNVGKNIVNSARIVGKSKLRQGASVYFGKKQFKAAKDIAKAIGITEESMS
jgi:hypothetical protein